MPVRRSGRNVIMPDAGLRRGTHTSVPDNLDVHLVLDNASILRRNARNSVARCRREWFVSHRFTAGVLCVEARSCTPGASEHPQRARRRAEPVVAAILERHRMRTEPCADGQSHVDFGVTVDRDDASEHHSDLRVAGKRQRFLAFDDARRGDPA